MRVELMEHFGYFVTESSGHASEYAPYFRKSARMVEEELVPRFTDQANHWFDFGRTGGYLRHCLTPPARDAGTANEPLPDRAHPRVRLLHHRGGRDETTDRSTATCPTAAHPEPAGWLLRRGPLSGRRQRRPADAVEHYPPQLAALNRTNINVQELIVEAA